MSTYSTATTSISVLDGDWADGRTYDTDGVLDSNGNWLYTLSSHSTNPDLAILFKPSTDTWSDNNVNHYPALVNPTRDASGYVKGYHNGHKFTILCPYFGNTYSTGGTSTEEVVVQSSSGSLTPQRGGITYVVDSTSSTATHYLKRNGIFSGGLHSNWSHTTGTESGSFYPNAEDGLYTLEYEEGLSPFDHVVIASLVYRRKVSCNFW
jgi:hypothetical protein